MHDNCEWTASIEIVSLLNGDFLVFRSMPTASTNSVRTSRIPKLVFSYGVLMEYNIFKALDRA